MTEFKTPSVYLLAVTEDPMLSGEGDGGEEEEW